MSSWIFTGNLGVPISAGAPTGRVNGQIWWDSADNKFKGTDPSGADVTIQGGSVATTSIVVMQRITVHDTAGAAEASFTFGSLNGDTDITYQIIGRWIKATAGDVALKVRPNNDSGNNYYIEYLYATNATTNAFRDNPGNGMVLDYHGGAFAGVSTCEGIISAKTGFGRSMVSRGGSADNGNATFTAMFFQSFWTDTANNITSIVVASPGATDIGIGSHFELWAQRTVKVVS